MTKTQKRILLAALVLLLVGCACGCGTIRPQTQQEMEYQNARLGFWAGVNNPWAEGGWKAP